MRGPYEGMWNVVRFNWPKYLVGIVVVFAAALAACTTAGTTSSILTGAAALAGVALILPLLASHLIYDRSDLYTLSWLNRFPSTWTGSVLNINAGFDETSALIRKRLPNCVLEVVDFYDPKLHTEASIERARQAYTSFPGTRPVGTDFKPLAEKSMDLALAFLSLHEVRNPQERIEMLLAINRILKPDGRLIITEHMRDLPNFIAFNFGYLHFHSQATWLDVFDHSGFQVESTSKTTAFLTTYILRLR